MNSFAFRQVLNARHPCIRIVSDEETEVTRMVFEAGEDLGLEPLTWSIVQGIRPGRFVDGASVPETENPAAALYWLRRHLGQPSLVVTFDLAAHLEDARTLRAWREMIEFILHGNGREAPPRVHLVMIDASDHVPPIVADATHRHYLPAAEDSEIEEVIRRTLRTVNARTPIRIDLGPKNAEGRDRLNSMIANMRGLTRRQIERITTQVVCDDRVLDASDVATVIRLKRLLLQAAGVLEFVDVPASMEEIGGLTKLKRWLGQREHAFTGGLTGGATGSMIGVPGAAALTPPRGVLLLGVQGAGKSLCAKAIATAWKRPLMKLDPSVLYDRYIGESEHRLREALRQAEAMSPVVLWIDEIEKGFAGASSTSTDGGLSRRMFGTLLNWMQEHRSAVFLVATANDIEALPPELLRKGRFDEIFFVDLPVEEARRMIFEIHLRRRGQDPGRFDLPALVGASAGFSGAEIEQGIIGALHEVYGGVGGVVLSGHPSSATVPPPLSLPRQLDTAAILHALKESPPLSVTMAEKVAGLRRWSVGRCVPAD